MRTILCRTRQQALQMARGGGKYYISSCDASDMNLTFPEDDKVLQNAFGEVRCYRSDNGDIFAWWEE